MYQSLQLTVWSEIIVDKIEIIGRNFNPSPKS